MTSGCFSKYSGLWSVFRAIKTKRCLPTTEERKSHLINFINKNPETKIKQYHPSEVTGLFLSINLINDVINEVTCQKRTRNQPSFSPGTCPTNPIKGKANRPLSEKKHSSPNELFTYKLPVSVHLGLSAKPWVVRLQVLKAETYALKYSYF